MSENNSNWTQGNFSGPNEKLLSLAEKLAQLARIGMETKLASLKEELRKEGQKYKHPIMDQFISEIEKLQIK